MSKKYLSLVIVLFTIINIQACKFETEYKKVKKRELASGKTANDLFLGFEFGMPQKDFFVKCWEMNKQGILINGAHALQIKYDLNLPSGKKALMFFYPDFHEEKIYFMPVAIQYDAWFPTNPETSAEKLIEDVVKQFELWHGEGFFKVEDKKGNFAMVKIDGNRLIRIYIKELSEVRVDMLDLRVKDIKDIYK
jgi:hypothetical protein